MSQIDLDIDFRNIHKHSDLILALERGFEAGAGDIVSLEISLYKHSDHYTDFLLLLVSAASSFRKSGAKVDCKINDIDRSSVSFEEAIQTKFFEYINCGIEEGFAEYSIPNQMTGIRSFSTDNSLAVVDEIIKLFISAGVNDQLLTVLNFCLWEVIDNTQNHSDRSFTYGKGVGFICAEIIQSDQLNIIVADNGVGIYQALTTHPDSMYKHFDEREAILHCIDNGVTNSLGKGFGLWARFKMAELNKGDLMIQSGQYELRWSENTGIQIYKTSNWQGAYTILRLKSGNPVDHQAIFGKDSSRDELFEEYKQRLFGISDELW